MSIDLTLPIAYRGYAANSPTRQTAAPLSGCQVDAVTGLSVRATGYSEKRARSDGRDASDVYLDGRRFSLRGQVYGPTAGEFWDEVDDLIAAFTPTLAYADDNAALGYLPLSFSKTSARLGGSEAAFINARALTTPDVTLIRDHLGVGGDKGYATTWAVEMEARDPRFYLTAQRSIDLSGAASASGTFTHRGTYPAALSITLVSDTSSPQDFHFIGAGADLTLTIPDKAGPCTITYDADTNVARLTYGGQTTLYMAALTWVSDGLPNVPAGGGSFSWSLSDGAHLLEGSELSYYEAFI